MRNSRLLLYLILYVSLRDDQPVFSTPFVTYFLIAINLLIYFFSGSRMQSRGQPMRCDAVWRRAAPRNRTVTGTPVFSPAAALLPISRRFLHGSLLHVLQH